MTVKRQTPSQSQSLDAANEQAVVTTHELNDLKSKLGHYSREFVDAREHYDSYDLDYEVDQFANQESEEGMDEREAREFIADERNAPELNEALAEDGPADLVDLARNAKRRQVVKEIYTDIENIQKVSALEVFTAYKDSPGTVTPEQLEDIYKSAAEDDGLTQIRESVNETRVQIAYERALKDPSSLEQEDDEDWDFEDENNDEEDNEVED